MDLSVKKNNYIVNKELFSQICSYEFIDIPCNLPDVEQIVSNVIDYEIISLKAINTLKGRSYEGQYLSGKVLRIEIKLRQKILYISEKNTQSVHIVENDFIQSVYIVIPCLIEGTNPEKLIKYKLLQCYVDIEDVIIKKVNQRKIYKSLCLLVRAELSHTYEICYAIHNRCRDSKIYIMHSDGTRRKLITNDINKAYRPLWSTNGREIAFIAEKGCDKLLAIYSQKTGKIRPLFKTSEFDNIGSYCWSANGTKLIFSALIDGYREVVIIDSNDTLLQQLTNSDGIYDSYNPRCSSCGQKIAFIRSSATGLSNIWITNFEGHDCKKITSMCRVYYYDWAPNGKHIIYIGKKNDMEDNIYIVYMDSMITKKINIHIPLTKIRKIQYSPNGECFAFIGSFMDDENIYIYNFSTNQVHKAIKNSKNIKVVTDFVWNADSNRIYYTAGRGSTFSIYVISIEDYQEKEIFNQKGTKIELSYRTKIC